MSEQKQNKPIDGYYEILYCADGVRLTVHPSSGKGRAVQQNEVIGKINRKKISKYNFQVLEHAIKMADGKSYVIAAAQDEQKIDAYAEVSVTMDKMKAFILIYPPEEGKDLGVLEMKEAIERAGVTFGIKEEILESLSLSPSYEDKICIAEGLDPIPGKNGQVIYHFDDRKQAKHTITEEGIADFKELNLIESAVVGQLLATVELPAPGTEGRNVQNQSIPFALGKPAPSPKGKNVNVGDNNNEYVSAIDGRVILVDGKINVFASYEVPADVDTTTGNIKFSGNVIVKGNVLSGYSIEALGYIEVCGSVEGATLIAGGDIFLRRGIQGMGKAIVKSGNNISSRFIENCAMVIAKNTIKAEAVLHSYVSCGDSLELVGGKGLLSGGSIKAGKLVSAKVIGSRMYTVTEIDVGVDPVVKERYRTVKEEISGSQNDLKKTDQAITLLKKISETGVLTPEKQEMLNRSIKTKFTLMARLEELKKEFSQLEEILQAAPNGKVRVQSVIYPGARVSIGTCLMYVKENIESCTLYKEGADVKIGPY